MKFSIITPSFRNSNWLKLCIASVADQQGVEFEHIVQDSCYDDGTQDWLPHDSRVKAFIEKDGGMYDAVNRGYRRAAPDVMRRLNALEEFVDPSEYYIRTTPLFEAPPGPYGWLADHCFVGIGERQKECLFMRFYMVL